MKVIDFLQTSISKLSSFNPDVQVAPSCILWPDGERQFESVLPQLRDAIPELLTLGAYDPSLRSGPAIWLRCAIDGKVPELSFDGKLPVIYMPGVSRAQMRNVEDVSTGLKPLVYLQYRGAFFSQVNSKDWTVFAFLTGRQSLNLDIAGDEATKNAMLLSLPILLDQEVALLQGKHLDKDDFNTLLSGGDPVKELLQFLNEGDVWRTKQHPVQWNAFVDLCKSNYSYDPEKDGWSKGLEKFASRKGVWKTVFDRYSESYIAYSSIASALQDQCSPFFDLFGNTEEYGGWPQWNEQEERKVFTAIAQLPADNPVHYLEKLKDLESIHASRRSLVWAKQGLASGAMILPLLIRFVELCQEGYLSDSFDNLAVYYESHGCNVDSLVWQILSSIPDKESRQIVSMFLRCLYEPWLAKTALQLQELTKDMNYPASISQFSMEQGTCLLFVDGLRLDVAKVLWEQLEQQKFTVHGNFRWAPLPTMTANGKPASIPIKKNNLCAEFNLDFSPLKGMVFQKFLTEHLISTELIPDKTCWKDFGDLDHAGHDHQEDMALHIPSAITEICKTVKELIEQGFKQVHIITDHGWLYLPGGLPKHDLPSGLTDGKWGRYAIMKDGASATNELQRPWFWNPNVLVSFPAGIGCHRAGMSYAHGGISLQECRLLELTVSSAKQKKTSVKISEITWRGLRCRCRFEGDAIGYSVDFRLNPTKEETSLVKPAVIKEDGTCSFVVSDDSKIGLAAFLLVLDENKHIVAQQMLQIGEE